MHACRPTFIKTVHASLHVECKTTQINGNTNSPKVSLGHGSIGEALLLLGCCEAQVGYLTSDLIVIMFCKVITIIY